MTSPEEPTSPNGPIGEVERVPLKVVPIFVQPIEDEPPVEEVILDEEAPAAPKRRSAVFALASVALAAGTIGVHVAAIVVASAGDFPAGTTLGYLAIGLSGLAVAVGIMGIIVGPRRGWAVVAVLVAVLANPWVLLTVLRLLSSLEAT